MGTYCGEEVHVAERLRAMTVLPLHMLFANVAMRQPENTAIRHAGEEITYRQLNDRADGLARAVVASGIARGAVIGVWLPRGACHVVAMLAVAKAGGCYLPLDPGLPQERLRDLVADSGCAGVVGAEDPETGARFVPVSRRGPDTTPLPLVDGAELAYVIYTSGSTGRPKGVAVPHASVVAMVADPAMYPLGPDDRAAQLVTTSFDPSILEIWCALLGGATLVIVDDDVRSSPERLLATFAAERITAAILPTPLFNEVAARPVPAGLELRRLLFGGDAASPRAVRAAFGNGLADVLVNAYGPTECTVVATYLAMDQMPSAVTIGSPRHGCVVRVLDRHGEIAPIGVRGEIYVGGPSLAAGYLGRPALTADRFVPDPGGPPGTRLYRTGDLARWRTDGTLEFLGRADDQVKINGHRVELEEVRIAVERHPGVEQAEIVVQHDDNVRRLVGYVVTADELSERDLREFVSAILPHYLTPAGFVRLGRLPVNANGKVDRRALPRWRPAPAEAGPAARGDSDEARLAAVWAEVLGLPEVGPLDNFFALGGDSILAMGVARRAADAGLRIDAAQVLRARTLSDLAAQGRDSAPDRTVAEVTGAAPLIPVQQWLLERGEEIISSELFVATKPLDLVLLDKALATVVERHQALRVRFSRGADGWRQVPGPPAGGLVRGPAPRAFDIEHGPLWRLVVSEGERHVLFESHHLITDAVSLAVFMDDLEEAYQALRRGRAPEFAPAPSSLAWAVALGELARSGVLRDQLRWWSGVMASAVALPHDIEAEPTADSRVWVPKEIDLGDLAPATIPAVLLGALAVAFREWTGRGGTVIDMQHHGRVTRPDLPSSLVGIGWYTSLSPVAVDACDLAELTDVDGADSLLAAVAGHLAARPDEGLGFGVLKYLDPDPEVRKLLRGNDAPVLVNYRGRRAALARQDGLFRVTPFEPDESADGVRGHDFEIVADVQDSTLCLSLCYSRSQYRDHSITPLLKAFDEAFAGLAGAASRNQEMR